MNGLRGVGGWAAYLKILILLFCCEKSWYLATKTTKTFLTQIKTVESGY